MLTAPSEIVIFIVLLLLMIKEKKKKIGPELCDEVWLNLWIGDARNGALKKSHQNVIFSVNFTA